MKNYLFLIVFLIGCGLGCQTNMYPSRVIEEQPVYDTKIEIKRIQISLPSAYSQLDNSIINIINDNLRALNNRKIIAITDEPTQGGANAINILYTTDDKNHSYSCFICKNPNVENVIAATSISGWRGSVAYYILICDKNEGKICDN